MYYSIFSTNIGCMHERFSVCFLYRRSRLWRSKPFGGIRIGAPYPNRAKYIQLGGIPIGAPYPRGRAPSSVETFFYCIPLSQIIPPAKAQKKNSVCDFCSCATIQSTGKKITSCIGIRSIGFKIEQQALKKALQTTVLIKFDVRDWGGKKWTFNM